MINNQLRSDYRNSYWNFMGKSVSEMIWCIKDNTITKRWVTFYSVLCTFAPAGGIKHTQFKQHIDMLKRVWRTTRMTKDWNILKRKPQVHSLLCNLPKKKRIEKPWTAAKSMWKKKDKRRVLVVADESVTKLNDFKSRPGKSGLEL